MPFKQSSSRTPTSTRTHPLTLSQSVAVKEFEQEQAAKRAELETESLQQFAVGGKEEEWEEALGGGQPGIVSVSR